jgi:hypothetical protein
MESLPMDENDRHMADPNPGRTVMGHEDDSVVARAALRHDPDGLGRRAPHRLEETRRAVPADDGRH